MSKNPTFETDWLGSTPVYFNERTGQVSHQIVDIIDVKNIALHPEGFNNYLEFGYSVFGQTPLCDIKYLPHSSHIERSESGTLHIATKDDIAEKHIGQQTTEIEALEIFRETVQQWEKSITGNIILPLSGGFDSRLLNHFITDKSRVRAFTYGTSENQARSFEVINAAHLAKNLGQSWEQIELTDFLGRIPDWEAHYSIATHAHGMYQMEFYEKIRAVVGHDGTVLSGIIGDAWAGSVTINPVTELNQVTSLGYSHGMHADQTQSLLNSDQDLKQTYFKIHRDKLKDDRWRVLESMRFKMVLLSYLLSTPRLFGFGSWSPFIEPVVALALLNLPTERRKNRIWQRDFFAAHPTLNLEKHYFKDRRNTLNLQAMRTTPLPPLDSALLREYVKPQYLEWINTTIARAPQTLRLKKLLSAPASLTAFLPGIHSLAGRFGLEPYTLKSEESRALSAYLTLHPIQTILKMRE